MLQAQNFAASQKMQQFRLLFFAGSSSVGPISFRLKIIMDQNGGQPISLATSPTPKTAFLVSSWTILSWSVCLSQDDFFWSDPEFRQAMFDDF